MQQGTLEIISNEQVVFERMQDTKSPVSTCGFQDSQLVSRMEPSVTGPGNLPIYNEIVPNIYEMDDVMADDGQPDYVSAEESALGSSDGHHLVSSTQPMVTGSGNPSNEHNIRPHSKSAHEMRVMQCEFIHKM